MFWGLRFEIKQKDVIQIPRYIGDIEFRYAKPIREDE